MTAGQERGWSVGFPKFGLTAASGLLNWESGWETQGRRVVEIGFGMGDSLLTMAESAPDDRFLGIEVHTPGVGRLLGQALERELQNIRVYAEDAMIVLDECIPKGSVDILQIFFPDPWHKKRHHKRRLIQPAFVAKAAALLATHGRLHLATDWMPYAEDMLSVLQLNRLCVTRLRPANTSLVHRGARRLNSSDAARNWAMVCGIWCLRSVTLNPAT